MSSLSYVTGSHNLKAGLEWGWGEFMLNRDVNADLTQSLSLGYAAFVDVEATPWRSTTMLKADLGGYVMDSWAFEERMTVNAGLRVDYINAYIPAQGSPAGRFAPLREVSEVSCMPCFPARWPPAWGLRMTCSGTAEPRSRAGGLSSNENLYLQLTPGI